MKKLDKTIFGTLFFSLFSTITGVGIVVPLLPVYARDLGASGLYIGMIFGAFSLSKIIFIPVFGRLSDRKGRKPFIVTGLFAYSLISLAFILSKDVKTLILIRFFHGFASAMMLPVIQAYVGDITPKGREGLVMGLFNMSMFLGMSVGPLLGGVINDRFSFNTAFLCMSGLTMIGFLLSITLLPPTCSEQVIDKAKSPAGWKHLLGDLHIAGLVIFRLTYTTCMGIIWGFLPVYASSEFSLSSSSIGILIMLGIFVSGLINVPMGYIADRISRVKMVMTGGVIVALAIWSFEWSRGFSDMVFASILFGLGGGISRPALMALAVLKGKQMSAMGSVMALLSMSQSLGMLAGSLLAGITMDFFQLKQTFFLGTVIMVVGLSFFIFCIQTRKDLLVKRRRGSSFLT
ncbi:MAG: MFS transporter [Desulfobacteraceae bacterium]|nr:MAG: MFS transporter [Desulfobacteraceae bacterium]